MSDIIPIQRDPVQTSLPNTSTITGTYAPYTPSLNPISSDVRLATLFNYTAAQIRDTWVNLGSMAVTNVVKLYSRNTVFKCNQGSTSDVNGCLFFCDSDYTIDATFDWDHMTLSDVITGRIIDKETMIIDPHFTLVLTKAAYDAITTPYNSVFLPFQETNTDCKLIIDDDELNRVLIDIGVPFIKVEELEFSREEIINLMIWPAVQIFYKWFPIETIGIYPLPGNKFNIEMPSWAWGCIRGWVIPGYPVGNVTNPLYRYFDEVLMQISPSGPYRSPSVNSHRRTGYQDNMAFATFALERAVRSGIINYSKRTRIQINNQGRSVTGFSTQRGSLELVWGSYSNLWSDIPFARLDEVRKLAKAYVLRSFAALRLQAKTDVGTINYEQFLNRADSLESDVIGLWKASAKNVVIRM